MKRFTKAPRNFCFLVAVERIHLQEKVTNLLKFAFEENEKSVSNPLKNIEKQPRGYSFVSRFGSVVLGNTPFQQIPRFKNF